MQAPTPRTLNVLHTTRYTYSEGVSLSRHRSYLTPRATPLQQVDNPYLTVTPPPREYVVVPDYFGNTATLFTVDKPHDSLAIEARSRVRLTPAVPAFTWEMITSDELVSRMGAPDTPDDRSALEFCFASPYIPVEAGFADYARECFGDDHALEGVRRLMGRIHSEFRYDPAITTVSTPVSEVFKRKGGVCQDFAHLMIACLRSAGLAARYVSGYLVPGAKVVGAQASHAWVAVYSPDTGWTDFDPTNNVCPSDGHITLAWGRDFSDVSPFSGVTVGGGEHVVKAEVKVESVG